MAHPIMKTLSTFLAYSALSGLASAAVINLAPGPRADDPVTGVNDWTLDAGLVRSTLSTNRIIFEAGGDGTGSALASIGGELVFYQDQGDFAVSTPAVDGFMTLSLGTLTGSIISIRLDADLSGAADAVTLTATDGTNTVMNSLNLSSNVGSIAGGNDTGFGVVAADLAGLDESAEPGSPNMAQFQNASYFNGGANALGADDLAGTLYTSLADQPPVALPTPSSWGLVPEPSTVLMLIPALGLSLRRRRV